MGSRLIVVRRLFYFGVGAIVIVYSLVYTINNKDMKNDTRERIFQFIVEQERVSPKTIAEHMRLTPQAIFRHLTRLLTEERIQKQGYPPKVFYVVKMQSSALQKYHFDVEMLHVLNEHFLKVEPNGVLQTGASAFVTWCLRRNLNPQKTAQEYRMTLKKYHSYIHHGVIDATEKMRKTFSDSALDALFHLDFYSIERFGKTKLGEMILYAKQGQRRDLIKNVVQEVRPRIVDLIDRLKIDAICFIPPTIQRSVQFMKEFEKEMSISLPSIVITKIKTPIIVPQKTLTKLEDRLENVKQSIVVEDTGHYKNILLIDDAVGSGATMYEVARQIRRKELCTGKIIGLGLVGSFNGFDVIQEV